MKPESHVKSHEGNEEVKHKNRVQGHQFLRFINARCNKNLSSYISYNLHTTPQIAAAMRVKILTITCENPAKAKSFKVIAAKKRGKMQYPKIETL
jgi:hypothetical protein